MDIGTHERTDRREPSGMVPLILVLAAFIFPLGGAAAVILKSSVAPRGGSATRRPDEGLCSPYCKRTATSRRNQNLARQTAKGEIHAVQRERGR